MKKRGLTEFSEVSKAEASNLEGATKYLASSALLIDDIESVYIALTPLIRFPPGDVSSDEAVAVRVIVNELLMSRLLFSKAILAALRMYQADSMVNVRRATESCAFAVRMSKHHELARVWSTAAGDEKQYAAYRKAFRTKDVFPENSKHPDYDPLLLRLKERMDICSKLIHGSVFGMAGSTAVRLKVEQNQLVARSDKFFLGVGSLEGL